MNKTELIDKINEFCTKFEELDEVIESLMEFKREMKNLVDYLPDDAKDIEEDIPSQD